MSIKLIAVDIDGTLVNSKKEITPEVFYARTHRVQVRQIQLLLAI